MPHRCVAGGCSNTSKNNVSLHGWPSDAQVARQWTKAVRNTRADFSPTASSKLCSSHFSDDSFETQSVIAQSLGLKMKKSLKPDAVPTIFNRNSGPPQKKQRREHNTDLTQHDPDSSSRSVTGTQQSEKQSRGAYRKREAATIIAEQETHTSREEPETAAAELLPRILAQEASTQTQRCNKNVAVQFRTKGTAKGIQTTVPTKSQGIQCTLLKPFVSSTPLPSDDEVTDSEEEMDANDDPSYAPDLDEDEIEEDDEFDDHDDCLYEESPTNAPAHQQNLFLVAESSLLNLFEFCPVCRSECDRKVNSRIGTKITVRQECLSCSYTKNWDSQPSIGSIPVGNIMMSCGILFGGGSPAKVLKIMRHMNVLTIAYSTFMKHQKEYLHPAVERTYRKQQSSLLDDIKAEGKELVLGGDGRCDSPGHSAKYGSYSLMDLEQNKILDSQLVQCNEVKNSNGMEKEGLARSLKFLTEDEGLSVNTLVTDRHVQIRKYMKDEWSGVKHRFDGWHIGKGIGKKIDSLAKKKDCAVVSKWKKSVVNHMFWCASSTNDEDEDSKEAKWLSVTNHIMNKHSGHDNPLFPKCLHGKLHGRERKKKWLKPGTPPFEKLTEILTKGSLVKDIRKISGEHATSSLEAFHSVQNHFATKRLAFSYHGMTSRLQISILHFNENSDREQAKLKDGSERVNITFPKYKKGEHTVKFILVQCSYRYVAELKEGVVRILEGIDSSVLERPAAPPSLSSQYDRPDKQAAVNALKSRFKNS